MAQGYEIEDSKKSTFNAAMFQMQRIANLQDNINHVSIHPLSFNDQYNRWNFDLWISFLNKLYQEGRPKFTSDEKQDLELRRDAIKTFLDKNPIVSFPKSTKKQQQDPRIIKTNWAVIEPFIIKYEESLRECLDVHNLNSPTQEDYDGL